MSTHSQGPWEVKQLTPYNCVIHPKYHTMWVVATAYTQADAQLIAAAPAMLEALKMALEAPDNDRSWEDDAIAAVKAADPLWADPLSKQTVV